MVALWDSNIFLIPLQVLSNTKGCPNGLTTDSLIILQVLKNTKGCHNQFDQKKIANCLQKLPKKDFTRKMNDFDIFTKLSRNVGDLGK